MTTINALLIILSFRRKLYKLIIVFCFFIQIQSAYSQYTSLGQWQDCNSFRSAKIGTQTIYLAKGEILDSFKFITWKPGLLNGILIFKNSKNDTFSFYPDQTYFLDTISQIAYEIKSFSACNYNFKIPIYGRKSDVPQNHISDSLTLHSDWLIIYNWYLDYDSMDWGICRFSGTDLNDLSNKSKPQFSAQHSNWDSFQFYIENQTRIFTPHCLCPEDTSMYGCFLDDNTGETIEIFQNPIRVYYGKFNYKAFHMESRHYNENKILNRKQLFVKSPQLGLLYVSFTPDFSRENYTLYYTGSKWLIPGKPGNKGSLGKPQYFHKAW